MNAFFTAEASGGVGIGRGRGECKELQTKNELKPRLRSSVTYPLADLLRDWLTMPAILLIIFALGHFTSHNTVPVSDVVIFISTYLLLYYFLCAQFRYCQVDIYDDRLVQTFKINIFQKKREVMFADAERFYVQARRRRGEVPFIRVEMKDGKRFRIRMPFLFAIDLCGKLGGTGVDVYMAKTSSDGSFF